MTATDPPVVMSIAATDSGGGAGIAADLKAFAANSAHGVFAVTAVTAQNTHEVRRAEIVPADVVGAQIDTVLDDFAVRAVKTGLLFGPENAGAVVERRHRFADLVVDPVLVTSTGDRIVADEAIDAVYLDDLLPAATVATPNVVEAGLLAGGSIETLDDARHAAAALHESGARHVVVTGLLLDDEAIDVHASAAGVAVLRAPRIHTANVHGTGCTFASTIAARLAHGDDAVAAIALAKQFVARGIAAARDWRLGEGHGPIDPFGFA